MRVLIDEMGGSFPGRRLDDEALHDLYRPPRLPWVRANMVSTLDGSATGGGGTSGSINNAVDKRVFDVLRGQADAVVVGAGTARAEGYGVAGVPLVLVSRQGRVPEQLRTAPSGSVRLVTCAQAPGLGQSQELLGPEHVLVLGEEAVRLEAIRETLVERDLVNLLCEGGPQLLGGMLAAREIDEICATVVPRLVGGDHPRIVTGPQVDVPLELQTLVEESGTLLGRWFVTR
jgi:riboflavin biosynthesis pyrimidine reductase